MGLLKDQLPFRFHDIAHSRDGAMHVWSQTTCLSYSPRCYIRLVLGCDPDVLSEVVYIY